MRRLLLLLIAALALACAFSGIWLGGLRNERQIAAELDRLPRLNGTPFFRCADSFYWVSYAREMIAGGSLRVRSTRMDNAPDGRLNSGWASLNAWYLVGLGKVWALATATPLRQALLPAAQWSGPILYFLALTLLLLLGWLLRNFAAATAAAFILGTSPRVYDDFAFAVPGHHGWHDLACFATLAALAAGIRRGNSREWFAAAGLFGAVAFWIGATQQAFGIAAAGAGALVGLIISRVHRKPEAPALPAGAAELPAAESWRVFGLAGSLGSLLLYLFEYAPGPFAMRLEVNHPIYAFSFFLGGEFLCRGFRLLLAQKPERRDIFVAAASAALLAGAAAAVLFGPAEWHTMRQPFMRRVHQEIAEFQPITLSAPAGWVLILGTPIFLVAAGVWSSLAGGRSARERVALLVCACPCAVAIALSFLQLRWAGIAGASAAALAAVLFADLGSARFLGAPESLSARDARFSWPIPLLHSAVICLSLGLIFCWGLPHQRPDAAQLRAEVIDRLATMEVATVLQADARSPRPIVIFSAQKERQAWIAYATGIAGVGSLYWDNPKGIRDEAEFLATYDDETAHRIARVRGVKFVVVTPEGGSVIAYHYMWQGNKTAPEIRQTLAYRLAAPHATPPAWLQLMPPSSPAMSLENIRVYRVL